MSAFLDAMREISGKAGGRLDLWTRFLNQVHSSSVMEIGVWKGEFAKRMLSDCGSIKRYYMMDPWRKLPAWNKPFNVNDSEFDDVFDKAIGATNFASGKRIVLRGTTTETIAQIEDESIDFCYVDGDHTLRGVTIDLINAYPKVKRGGYLCGDDLSPTIWQHSRKFEPTLVFPFAVYFAEAVGAEFVALPFLQFAMRKPTESREYRFLNLTSEYSDLALHAQFERKPISMLWNKVRARLYAERS